MVAVQIARSTMDRNSLWLPPLHVVLDLRGQGGEVALAAVIDNNDEPM